MTKRSISLLLAGLLSTAVPCLASTGESGESVCDAITEAETTDDDIKTVVGTLVRAQPTVTRDVSTGTLTVTVPGAGTYAIRADGPTRHHCEDEVEDAHESGDGSLRLKDGAGREIRIRATHHDERELARELRHRGWHSVGSPHDHAEVESEHGEIWSVVPAMKLEPGTPGPTAIQTVNQGELEVRYLDGWRQRYHGYPHDLAELAAKAREIGATQVTVNSDGTLDVLLGGIAYRVKLDGRLQRALTAQPGIRAEEGRIIVGYGDGFEQEVIEIR